MLNLTQDFKDFLKLLTENHARYLIIGGYAVGYYGYPRATADLDIWVEINQENAKALVNTITNFGFSKTDVKEGDFLKEGKIIRMGFPPFRIEIITSISGVTFEDCYKRKLEIEEQGIKICLISREDLIENKKAAGRFKDKADLEKLE